MCFLIYNWCNLSNFPWKSYSDFTIDIDYLESLLSPSESLAFRTEDFDFFLYSFLIDDAHFILLIIIFPVYT